MYIILLCLQAGTGGKREPWSLLFQEFGGNQLTTQATATSIWWTLPIIELASSYHVSIHCPGTTPLERDQPSSGERSNSDSKKDISGTDYNFTDAAEERKSYFPNQKDLNNLIRDLGLTYSYTELLTSMLKEWKLLNKGVQVTDQRKHHQCFSNIFNWQDGLCFCNNVADLFEPIGIACNPNERCLIIEFKSLKAIWLHNGNKYPFLSMAHSVYLKRTIPVSRCY